MSRPKCLPFLPHELLWNILSWLPVKSLMRFRCVCKSWNSLISDDAFVKLHLQRSSPNILCDINYPYEMKHFLQCYSIESLVKDPSFPLHDFSVPLSYGRIIGVCNGLVCLATTTETLGRPVQACIQLWNPATRLMSQKLYFQSDRSIPLYQRMGFGYDNSRDTYKVVAVVNKMVSAETEVRVQCLGENCSRKVASWIGFPYLATDRAQYLHGTLNWVARTSVSNKVIYSFDLRDETYKYLFFPDIDLCITPCDLDILRGCLSFYQYNHKTHHLCVWQMKEFGAAESWSQLINVSCDCASVRPLYMSQNGNFLLAKLGIFHLVMYNRRDNTQDLFRNPASLYLWKFFHYVQSLVLPY